MEYVNSGLLVILSSTLWLMAWVGACYGIGAQVMGRFLVRHPEAQSHVWLNHSWRSAEGSHFPLFFVFSVSIGLFFLSLWVFVIGSVGQLKLVGLLPFLIVGVVLFLWQAGCSKYFGRALYCHEKPSRRASGHGFWPKGQRPEAKRASPSESANFPLGNLTRVSNDCTRPFRIFICLLFPLILLISYIATLAPETGNDALNYHLYFPKLYVERSKIFFDEMHPRSLWPFMMEMLFTAGLLCQGVALAKLFHWLTAVLAIFAVPSAAIYLAKSVSLMEIPRASGSRNDNQLKDAAWMSFIFIATIPAIWMQSLYAYVDNGMMLYTFLSFVALWIWKEKGLPFRGAFIPAIFLSALISIKFYSLVPAALLIFLFLAQVILRERKRPKNLPRDSSGSPTRGVALGMTQLLFFSVLCLLFCGFWFVRSWDHWGNPVFPFFPDLFGAGFHARAVGFSEMPKTFLNFLSLPWNLPMKVKTFGGEPIGILFLVCLPLLLFSYKRIKGILFWIALFCFLYLSVWFLLIQHTRFLFPLFPFLSLLFGVVILRSRMIFFLFGGIVFIQFLISLYYPAKHFKAGVGWISADDYLTSNERSYAFLKEVKSLLNPNDKILFVSEPRLFYTPAAAVFYGPAIDLILKKQNLSFSEWIQKNKIEYLLVKDKDASRLDPKYHLRFGHRLELPYFQVLTKKIEAENQQYHYVLWKIK